MLNYTEIGKNEGYEKENIDEAIKRTIWEDFRKNDLPFMQGYYLKEAIKLYKIPLSKISRMCLHNYIKKDGEEHGFYSIEVNYRNGIAKIYFVDDGCSGCAVASELK